MWENINEKLCLKLPKAVNFLKSLVTTTVQTKTLKQKHVTQTWDKTQCSVHKMEPHLAGWSFFLALGSYRSYSLLVSGCWYLTLKSLTHLFSFLTSFPSLCSSSTAMLSFRTMSLTVRLETSFGEKLSVIFFYYLS